MPTRLTTAEFIARAREVHGDLYDYSAAQYVSTNQKVAIRCRVHGEFEQTPNRHLSGRRGCPTCTHECVATKARLTTEEFIARARGVHGEVYDYSTLLYTGARGVITVQCLAHGPFQVTATAHTTKAVGCPACTKERVVQRLRTKPDGFLAQLKEVLGEDGYDYSETRHVDRQTPVRVICRTHGPFERLPRRQFVGTGCSECRREKTQSGKRGGRSVRWTTEQFIARAREIHGGRYDYSQVEYVSAWTRVVITCPVHGDFEKAPVEHIHRGRGCGRCAHEARARRAMKSTAEWVEESREVHGDEYDYADAEYNGAKASIRVICRRHGPFMANAEAHLRGNGCARCRQSLGERAVAAALAQSGIHYVTEFSDKTLRKERVLRFDFALPGLKVLIEFDGEQHRRVVQWGNDSPEEAAQGFLDTVERDAMKTRWAAENGWRLIRLKDLERVLQDLVLAGVISSVSTKK